MNRTKILTRATSLAIAACLLSTPSWADFEQAMSYFKGGKYVEAAAEFQALVDESPGYADGYQMLGLSFVQMNKPKEAVESFQKAIELNGDRFEFHHGLANAYFKARDFGKAVATLRTAEGLAESTPHKYALYNLRGLSYIGLEKWSDAIEDLDRAKAIKSSPSILENLGLAYYNLGHHDKAIPNLKAALKASPGDATALLMLTNGLMDLGAEAPSDAQKQANYDEALSYAEQYQKVKPSSYESHNLVARAALGAKQYDKADRAFQRVLEMKPDHCYAMVNRGKIAIQKEDWTTAEKVLGQAATCAPRMSVVYESMGFALQKQERLEEAIAQYEKAKSLNPAAPVTTLIATCRENIRIRDENKAMDSVEAQNQAEIDAEKARLEEAERLRLEWEKKTARGD